MSAPYPILEESTRNSDGSCTHKCGTDLLGKRVAHPVWHKTWDGLPAGGGEVDYDTVPYCPKCQQEPVSNGRSVLR